MLAVLLGLLLNQKNFYQGKEFVNFLLILDLQYMSHFYKGYFVSLYLVFQIYLSGLKLQG
ncbi:hypothetical protein ACX27_24860 [Nostoc piscinale CENA21]|uniref:Uncharacterized protein n=1 Tax=Nostoc piscinale CENA21 TaxID=224013 RepID=A0A0M4T067_9NOSO|nr:hypothetical protein ACX27_24860 [Nostoc piscinale CENA21]